jgi:hypothetical protein
MGSHSFYVDSSLIEINDGAYNENSLVIEINSKLPSDISLVYNSQSAKFSFTSLNNKVFSLKFDYIENASMNYNIATNIDKNQLNDFWILINPNFLKDSNISNKIKNTNYLKKINNNNNFYSVLISTNIEFIKWIKLRIGYFENIDEPLNNENLKSDGIYLELNNSKLILKDNYIALSPEILVKQFQYGSVN